VYPRCRISPTKRRPFVIPSAQRRKRKASWYAGVDRVFGIMELRASQQEADGFAGEG
jgi:hypothetical protein